MRICCLQRIEIYFVHRRRDVVYREERERETLLQRRETLFRKKRGTLFTEKRERERDSVYREERERHFFYREEINII